jgi:hypothetical protein
MPEVTSRVVSYGDMQRDVELIMDVFNDAWSDNWGFVPLTRPEIDKTAKDFKLFLMPEITRIVSIDGEPAAVAVAIPNLNELIADLGGKLFPARAAEAALPAQGEGAEDRRASSSSASGRSGGTCGSTRALSSSSTQSSTTAAEAARHDGRRARLDARGQRTGEHGHPLMGAKPYKRYRSLREGAVRQ